MTVLGREEALSRKPIQPLFGLAPQSNFPSSLHFPTLIFIPNLIVNFAVRANDETNRKEHDEFLKSINVEVDEFTRTMPKIMQNSSVKALNDCSINDATLF